ncbi:hypothetical protein AB0G79_01800 [Streptomyces sp. NPDC020807]|uniref:hypothetical protein n=1 Tax=Streptomyces sp. NPDC020807 TaxID=3155119 RepID=UPI0033F9680E
MQGTRNRTYSAPSFAAFTRYPHVTNVISGTVTALRAEVSDPEGAAMVHTVLTIDVESQRKAGAPTTAYVREGGGVVTVEQVRATFEDKMRRKLTKKELDQKIDYRYEGTEHARVGDHVLVVVTEDSSVRRPDAYSLLARLVDRRDGIPSGSGAPAKAASVAFTWAGEAPNAAWEKTVDADSLASLMK